MIHLYSPIDFHRAVYRVSSLKGADSMADNITQEQRVQKRTSFVTDNNFFMKPVLFNFVPQTVHIVE